MPDGAVALPDRTITPIEDDGHWHALRSVTVGASEVAALFDASPYLSAYRLHHVKAGTVPTEDLSGDVRVLCGRELEPAIAGIIARVFEVRVRPARHYLRLGRLGATLDFEVWSEIDGRWVPLEIKNVDRAEFRSHWAEVSEDAGEPDVASEGSIDPPAHIALQCQAQMLCAGTPSAYLGVLVGGNTPHLIRQVERPKLQTALMQRVDRFWRQVEVGHPPGPDWDRDLDTIRVAMAELRPGEVDRSGDETLETLMLRYAEASAVRRAAQEKSDGTRARILSLIGDAEKVRLNAGTISTRLLPAQEAGERVVAVKARPARREVRVYPKRGLAT